MREGILIKVILLWVIFGILPMVTYAEELVKINSSNHLMINELTSMDSLLKTKPQQEKGSKKKKDKDAPKDNEAKEPDVEKGKEPRQEPGVDIEPKRPDIKEVPKARPKLRPGVVDKVKIKRPPVKVKPGKGLRINL
ncbi:MAG TPA: hypothetical protein VGB63_03785 [Pedobacter sp.]|jgi:hypothetical protein